MKKILKNKLVFKKQIVSSLNDDEMNKIYGGVQAYKSATLECVPSFGQPCPPPKPNPVDHSQLTKCENTGTP